MITLYYCFGLLFFILISLYIFAYKEIGYKIDILRTEYTKTGYMSNKYKLHLAVYALKILFVSYATMGLFSYHMIYFFAVIVLMFISQANWHYLIKKIIYLLISVILFIILYDYFK